MVNVTSLTRTTLFSVTLIVCIAAFWTGSASAAPSSYNPLKSSNSNGYTRLPHHMTLGDYLKIPKAPTGSKSFWTKFKK